MHELYNLLDKLSELLMQISKLLSEIEFLSIKRNSRPEP
jgi:hypothetical protein